MIQTEHFELNIVEGSDIVNPLVIDNPNYEKIDAQMFANQNGTVGTATELTSNTIHALTRANGNTNMFRFTATSNYNLGDTFTVDGVNVTALLPNGKTLGDKAYIIGGTVLCSLVGTLLTIYTFAVAEADDSARLGGELPSYYATKAEVDNAQSLAEGAATIAQESQSEISNINARMNLNILGSVVALTGYTINTPYTAPTDGYIRIQTDKYATSLCKLSVMNNQNSGSEMLYATGNGTNASINSMFVRKGTRVFVSGTGTYLAHFIPLV